MVIIAWLICVILLFFMGISLTFVSFRKRLLRESLRTVWEGFNEGLKGCGLCMKKQKYPVELWEWVTMDDEDVCDDCLERASLPAMDIADWMKEGMPGTEEAQTECGKNCRCRLVPYKPKVTHKGQHHKPWF